MQDLSACELVWFRAETTGQLEFVHAVHDVCSLKFSSIAPGFIRECLPLKDTFDLSILDMFSQHMREAELIVLAEKLNFI
jgi:hypothetical protein